MCAVSYTHLDVYKRQIQGTILIAFLLEALIVSVTKFDVLKSSLSSLTAIGAIMFITIASHFVRERPNLGSKNLDINFEEQSAVLKLKS